MIENFTLDTDANPENMNMLIEGINKNEQDIEELQTNVEGVSSAIGQIANDRGYLNSKSLGSDIDLNNFFIQGKYYSSTCLNRPNSDAFIIDISGITSANSAITQKATCYYGAGNVNFGRTYERTYYQASGGWTAWKEIATGTNTPTIKNVPAGTTKIKDLPMGIYRIYAGSTYFIDYPLLAKRMAHDYGILEVVSDAANYKTYSFTATDANAVSCTQYIGFSNTDSALPIKWSGETPYSPQPWAGLKVIEQRSFIQDGKLNVRLDIQKADGSSFAQNVQIGAATFPAIPITYPKNIMFSCWTSRGAVLVGNGGVGTLFVDRILYIIPQIACDTIRISGEIHLE